VQLLYLIVLLLLFVFTVTQ